MEDNLNSTGWIIIALMLIAAIIWFFRTKFTKVPEGKFARINDKWYDEGTHYTRNRYDKELFEKKGKTLFPYIGCKALIEFEVADPKIFGEEYDKDKNNLGLCLFLVSYAEKTWKKADSELSLKKALNEEFTHVDSVVCDELQNKLGVMAELKMN